MSLLDRLVSLLLPAVPKPIVRIFSRPYIAGPTMDDAIRTVRDLAREGAMSTLDILGEFITSTEAALMPLYAVTTSSGGPTTSRVLA